MSLTSPERQARLTELVAEEVRALMGRRRITGAALARRLGVSQMWVSDRLRGIQDIDLTDLERIAAVLEVEVTSLLLPAAGSLPRSGAVSARRDGQAITEPYRTAAERMTVDKPNGGLVIGGVRRARRIGDPLPAQPIAEAPLAAAA